MHFLIKKTFKWKTEILIKENKNNNCTYNLAIVRHHIPILPKWETLKTSLFTRRGWFYSILI